MLNVLLAISIILILLDAVWISFVSGPLFNTMIKNIQGHDININIVGAALSYFCLVIGVYWFGYRNIDPDNVWQSALGAGLFGFVGYGLFDFTNMAIMDKWVLGPALIDVAWGGILCYTTVVGTHFVVSK